MNIAVLVSGGIDSSLALRLLYEKGHNLTAFYLKIWLEDELSFLGEQCPWEEDLGYLRAICDDLAVPLEVISLQKEYWEEVVNYVLEEVKVGRTPNPDMLCNQKIKFGKFYEKIDLGFAKVATGHYACQEERKGIVFLKTAKDKIKDQTYFLAHLTQGQLRRAFFPIGDYLKSEVRELAKQYNLPNFERKDSQGICFLGKVKFDEFLKYHLGEKPGFLYEFETGKKLGEHAGYWFYTIGQRKGIGLSGGPWFVVAKDISANAVYISSHYYDSDKNRHEFFAKNLNWISGFNPKSGEIFNLKVKTRHGPCFYQAKVTVIEDAHRLQVNLDQEDQGLARGQFAVFYDQGFCLGCGAIE